MITGLTLQEWGFTPGRWFKEGISLANAMRAYCKADAEEIRLPYLDRNRAIVTATTRLIAAVKGPEETRSGTWSTIRFAEGLRRPVYIFHPDGWVETRWGLRATEELSVQQLHS